MAESERPMTLYRGWTVRPWMSVRVDLSATKATWSLSKTSPNLFDVLVGSRGTSACRPARTKESGEELEKSWRL